MDKDFPRWLIEQRKERGWSQADLARAARTSPQLISQYENYKRTYYDPTILQKIARAFKLPVETVYRAAGYLPPATEEEELIEEIKGLVESLPPEYQEDAREYIRMKVKQAEERDRREAARNRKTRPSTG